MNVKKISVGVILIYSFTIIAFSSPLIMINYTSTASYMTIIILVLSYIVGELYLWKRKLEDDIKERLHIGLINISLSISFFILAIAFLMYGYKSKWVIISVLFLIVYCLSGVLFSVLYLKRVHSNGRQGKIFTSASIGLAGGAVIGIGGARLLLKDTSQSTLILIAISIGCFLSIAFFWEH